MSKFSGSALTKSSFVKPMAKVCSNICIAFKFSDAFYRLDDVKLWGREDIDGHICQAVRDGIDNKPSRALSKYLEREVLLVVKGQKARPCLTTLEFPSLKATAMYQDGYPLLIASEESLVSVQERMRLEVGKQYVSDRWAEDELVMERYRDSCLNARNV